MLGLPLNPGCINRNHTHGTHAPVEPSTASEADISASMTNRAGLRSPAAVASRMRVASNVLLPKPVACANQLANKGRIKRII
jgi:hypothetical protein